MINSQFWNHFLFLDAKPYYQINSKWGLIKFVENVSYISLNKK